MKRLKGQKGFTLIEMLIVLLIISVLILIMIPNVTKHFNTIDNKGCSAYLKMIDSQIEAYRIENRDSDVTAQDLADNGYLNREDFKDEKLQCPNGDEVVIKNNKAELLKADSKSSTIDNTENKS